ncbi:MAG: 30S ribosomal protein S7, partial [Prevotella sp.]|nr:30S ribosomal protein S7 [Prevotella sp.]
MRKAKPKKRVVLPDPIFGDEKVTKFVNHLMYDGKKNIAYEIFYTSLAIVKSRMAKEGKSPLGSWWTALVRMTPSGEGKSRRIGG